MIEILHLDISTVSEHSDPVEGLGWFYSHLPRVTEISISGRYAGPFAFRKAFLVSWSSILPHLHTLTTPFFPIYNYPFRSFTSSPSLRHLHITEFDLRDESDNLYLDDGSVSNLDTLEIDGDSAEHPLVSKFCQTCPRLANLALSTYNPDYRTIGSSLSDHLTHLFLWNKDHSSEHAFVDHFLPRFPNLVQLALGSDLFSQNVTQHLASLASLKSLKLGKGLFNAQEMISLITDVDGFGELEYLYLDTMDGVIGERIVPQYGWQRKTWYRPEDDYWEDWYVPEFTDDWGVFSLEDAKELVDIAEEYGVKVDGDLIGAIVTTELYHYEVSNLAILRSYFDADLSYVDTLHADDALNLRLPPLDLDNLDPNNLQLVKREPPEDDWVVYNFNLSLKNRDSSESDVEDGGKKEVVNCDLVYDKEEDRFEILWKL